MSYDLYLKPKSGAFSKEDFARYFGDRKHYTLEGSQAWYQNEDTGVYFLFELQEADEQSPNEHYPVVFNMNFFRPSYFVKEAETEVRRFISQFSMIVEDRQVHGMGVGEYDSEKFVSGWLHGNEFGYKAILKDHPDVMSLPTEKLQKTWEWNVNRENLQNSVADDVFVPSIMLLSYKGNPVTVCVWPDAIPSILPEVDILLIGRTELAPRTIFKKSEGMAIGSWFFSEITIVCSNDVVPDSPRMLSQLMNGGPNAEEENSASFEVVHR